MTISRYISSLLLGGTFVLSLSLSACRSAFVETTIANNGDTPLRLIEVDYPSASFGTQTLAPHSVFHYRFKIQGSGAITLTFTDQANKAHTAAGPELKEGQQGNLQIAIDSSGNPTWTTALSNPK